MARISRAKAEKSAANNYVRNVNNVLGKNRRILESLLPDGEVTAKANHHKLMEKGFQFKYQTHLYSTKNVNTYFIVMIMAICPWRITGI
jgi:hypothetical protein